MKMLVCSDLHFDKRTLGVPRHDDVLAAVDQTIEAAVRERVALWACLGDVGDPDAGPASVRTSEAIVHVATELRRHAIDQVWVAGNHDVFEDSSGATSLSPLRPLQGMLPGTGRLVLAERPTTFELGPITFLCLPYVATSHPYDADAYLEDNLPGDLNSTIVLGHLHLPNMHPGEESLEMARGRELMFPIARVADRSRTRCFNGHYHAPGCYSGVHVPGSLVRFTFGERHAPSFMIVDLEDS